MYMHDVGIGIRSRKVIGEVSNESTAALRLHYAVHAAASPGDVAPTCVKQERSILCVTCQRKKRRAGHVASSTKADDPWEVEHFHNCIYSYQAWQFNRIARRVCQFVATFLHVSFSPPASTCSATLWSLSAPPPSPPPRPSTLSLIHISEPTRPY